MRKIKIILIILCSLLLLVTDGYIIYQSLQESKKSSNTSANVTDIVIETVDKINPSDISIEVKYGREAIHKFVRKFIGHFMLSAISGVFAALLIVLIIKKHYLKILILLLHAIFIAGTTEIIQLFKMGRSGNIMDFLINMSGFSISIIVVIIYILIIKGRDKTNE